MRHLPDLYTPSLIYIIPTRRERQIRNHCKHSWKMRQRLRWVSNVLYSTFTIAFYDSERTSEGPPKLEPSERQTPWPGYKARLSVINSRVSSPNWAPSSGRSQIRPEEYNDAVERFKWELQTWRVPARCVWAWTWGPGGMFAYILIRSLRVVGVCM